MSRSAIRPVLLATLILGCPGLPRAASFTVHDGRAAPEVGEATELYIDEKLVASFRLDGGRRQIDLTLTVPDRRDGQGHEAYGYALCGAITIRNAQGGIETHEVNATGLLHDPDGHRFEALGAAGFTRFFLADPADPGAAESTTARSGLCRAAIS